MRTFASTSFAAALCSRNSPAIAPLRRAVPPSAIVEMCCVETGSPNRERGRNGAHRDAKNLRTRMSFSAA
jgi:hypothetical protein